MKYGYGYYWLQDWRGELRIARYVEDGWILLEATNQDPHSLKYHEELGYKVIERIQEPSK